jgi:hypothetical protein
LKRNQAISGLECIGKILRNPYPSISAQNALANLERNYFFHVSDI